MGKIIENCIFQALPQGIGFDPWAINELSFAEYGLYMALATCSWGLTFGNLMEYSKDSSTELEKLLKILIKKGYIEKEGCAK